MATANAATTFLENRLLSFIFKNNAASFSSPGDGIYVGLATAVSNFNDSTGESGDPSITEATFTNYARQQVGASSWTTIGADSTDTQTAINAANIEFPASGGTNNTITHVFIINFFNVFLIYVSFVKKKFIYYCNFYFYTFISFYNVFNFYR